VNTSRHCLGAWVCRSGNSLDVFVEPSSGEATCHVRLEWDSPPPLSAADQIDYDLRILPEVVRRAGEYLERVGPVVVVRR
jgi:hypothetical protein